MPVSQAFLRTASSFAGTPAEEPPGQPKPGIVPTLTVVWPRRLRRVVGRPKGLRWLGPDPPHGAFAAHDGPDFILGDGHTQRASANRVDTGSQV